MTGRPASTHPITSQRSELRGCIVARKPSPRLVFPERFSSLFPGRRQRPGKPALEALAERYQPMHITAVPVHS